MGTNRAGPADLWHEMDGDALPEQPVLVRLHELRPVGDGDWEHGNALAVPPTPVEHRVPVPHLQDRGRALRQPHVMRVAPHHPRNALQRVASTGEVTVLPTDPLHQTHTKHQLMDRFKTVQDKMTNKRK